MARKSSQYSAEYLGNLIIFHCVSRKYVNIHHVCSVARESSPYSATCCSKSPRYHDPLRRITFRLEFAGKFDALVPGGWDYQWLRRMKWWKKTYKNETKTRVILDSVPSPNEPNQNPRSRPLLQIRFRVEGPLCLLSSGCCSPCSYSTFPTIRKLSWSCRSCKWSACSYSLPSRRCPCPPRRPWMTG